jgi:integrase
VAKQKRTKTKHTCIYFNENTKKYDIKYNYKEYNPLKQKNDYKQKWVCGIATLTEAKAELANLQAGGVKPQDKDITLQGAFELWKIKMQANNSSPVTIKDTQQHLKMISQFIPLETRIKDITEDTYMKFCSDIREYGYSEETLFSLNATFRKLINLAYKKRLVLENVLSYSDNMKTKKKEDYRLIELEEFKKLSGYFQHNNYVRNGMDIYSKYRFLINLLYYTGIRIGECLALTYNDFEEFSYYKDDDPEKPIYRLGPSTSDTELSHLQGTRVKITKSYVSDLKITKDPKNLKTRKVPLPSSVERLAMIAISNQKLINGSLDDKIFNFGYYTVNSVIKNACKKVDIPPCSCHDFRHTYISNLVKQNVPLSVIEKVSGDNQATILRRYSHMFEQDEVIVLRVMNNL